MHVCTCVCLHPPTIHPRLLPLQSIVSLSLARRHPCPFAVEQLYGVNYSGREDVDLECWPRANRSPDVSGTTIDISICIFCAKLSSTKRFSRFFVPRVRRSLVSRSSSRLVNPATGSRRNSTFCRRNITREYWIVFIVILSISDAVCRHSGKRDTSTFSRSRADFILSLSFSFFIFIRRGSARKDVASRIAREKKKVWEQAQLHAILYNVVVRRIRNGSSRIYELELRVSRIPARRVLHFSTALVAAAATRARGSKLFSLLDGSSSSCSFFFRSPHVRGAYSIRKERGFRDSRFFLSQDSLCFASLLERVSPTRLFSHAFHDTFLHLSFFPQAEDGVRETGFREDRDSATLRDGEYDHCYIVKLVVSVKCRNVSLDCLCVLFFFSSSSPFLSRVFHIQNNHARSTAKPPRLLSINCILQPRAGTELYISSLHRA